MVSNYSITEPTHLLHTHKHTTTFLRFLKVMHLPEVARMYDVAERILGYDLKKLVLEGPENLLNQTLHSQPALLIAGLAAVEKLKHENPSALDQISYVAGLSLGEYTALVFAGALTFEDALRLVQVRAMAMQAASETTKGEMMTVIGLEDAALKRHCVKARKLTKEFVQISNFLNPKGRVISGQPNAVAAVRNVLQANTSVRLFDVPVSGAFHTKLMASARDALVESLGNTEIREPTIPVVANINGRPYNSPEDIQEGLARQLVDQVMWQKSIEYMIDKGIKVMYDMGPGKQIMGMIRQINKPIAKSDRPTAVNISV